MSNNKSPWIPIDDPRLPKDGKTLVVFGWFNGCDGRLATVDLGVYVLGIAFNDVEEPYPVQPTHFMFMPPSPPDPVEEELEKAYREYIDRPKATNAPKHAYMAGAKKMKEILRREK